MLTKQQSEIRYLPIDNHAFADRSVGDIMTIPAARIPETRVDMTILGGEIRYTAQ